MTTIQRCPNCGSTAQYKDGRCGCGYEAPAPSPMRVAKTQTAALYTVITQMTKEVERIKGEMKNYPRIENELAEALDSLRDSISYIHEAKGLMAEIEKEIVTEG